MYSRIDPAVLGNIVLMSRSMAGSICLCIPLSPENVKSGLNALGIRIMTLEVLEIESLDLEARGVAHRDGKVVFVEGALPGERVLACIALRKPSLDRKRTRMNSSH